MPAKKTNTSSVARTRKTAAPTPDKAPADKQDPRLNKKYTRFLAEVTLGYDNVYNRAAVLQMLDDDDMPGFRD